MQVRTPLASNSYAQGTDRYMFCSHVVLVKAGAVRDVRRIARAGGNASTHQASGTFACTVSILSNNKHGLRSEGLGVLTVLGENCMFLMLELQT